MLTKGEQRSFEAIAGVLCECHFTDGFCNGRDRPECQCNKLAKTALDAIKSRGVELVWPASPTQQDRREA
jgi:hypothetical protein